MRQFLWPVTKAACSMEYPASNSRDVASWRRSWKCRSAIPAAAQITRNVSETSSGEYGKMRASAFGWRCATAQASIPPSTSSATGASHPGHQNAMPRPSGYLIDRRTAESFAITTS